MNCFVSISGEKRGAAFQYRAALAKLALTQVGAARLFGIGGRTSRRWAKQGVDGPAAILLRLLLARKIKIGDIERAGG